jgi:hypothetical protein
METLEQAMPPASQARIDLAVFSDAELDRLEEFAEQCAAWPGDDWVEAGLTPDERRELDALLAKVRPAPN